MYDTLYSMCDDIHFHSPLFSAKAFGVSPTAREQNLVE